MKNEIKSEKILVGKIFSEMWFRIPEYQRPYVWGSDQVTELLEDTCYAMLEKPDSEYFLGSFVFQSHKKSSGDGIEFTENDLLDGQQRITTMLLIFSVLRDRVKDQEAAKGCQECIFQSANKFKRIPERSRIVFEIRQEAIDFIDNLSKNKGFTQNNDKLRQYEEKALDISVRNMARATRLINQFFDEKIDQIKPEEYFDFLLNNLLMIYVATENLEDAFRLFTILNDRGMPLRNSDILKSINLGALQTDQEKKKYAALWENAESELGEDFDRFLSHVRTILVKEKARLSLLQEYEDKIYDPKEKEKATSLKKPALLKKGKETFDLIKLHLENYQQIISGSNYDITNDFKFDNLIKTMFVGLPATDWLPPLLRYYEKFEGKAVFEFLTLLDNKFSADWIVQLTPTARIEAMNDIIKEIDAKDHFEDVLASEKLMFDADKLFAELDGKIYGRRFARYVLLKLDYLYQDHSHKMNHETISVEHILPQNPAADSQWCKDFTEEQRQNLTDTLGNLVLISMKKNTSQGRLDYKQKKDKYFKEKINTCPNSLHVLNQNNEWDASALDANHKECVKKLKGHYSFHDKMNLLNEAA